MNAEVYRDNDGSESYGSVQVQKGCHITVGGVGTDGKFRPIRVGSATAGSAGNIQVDATVSGTVSTSGVGSVAPAAISTSVGLTRARTTNLIGSVVTSIKAAAGNLYDLQLTNPNGSVAAYVCLYNAVGSTVTVGSTSLTMNKITVPAASQVYISFDPPAYFSTAISMAATLNEVDTDATNVGSALYATYRYA